MSLAIWHTLPRYVHPNTFLVFGEALRSISALDGRGERYQMPRELITAAGKCSTYVAWSSTRCNFGLVVLPIVEHLLRWFVFGEVVPRCIPCQSIFRIILKSCH